MADFSALKTSIQNYIKQNGNEEITGNLLQQILLSMVSTLGDSAINDLVTALNAEIANRGNADTELDGRITTLQGVVNGVIANVENGYVYAGIATPSSTPASGKVFYLALTAGTYSNFGATVVPQGINILKYNGSAWSLDSFLGLDDAPTQGSSNLVKSGGVLDSIIKDGSAFDLSAYNNGTTYADLSAALTALNALPAAYKKGGMSVKFVHTSDNKYVQYRLMSDSFNTIVANWQGVDDEPTAGSQNLVKSGGVDKDIKLLEFDTKGKYPTGTHSFVAGQAFSVKTLYGFKGVVKIRVTSDNTQLTGTTLNIDYYNYAGEIVQTRTYVNINNAGFNNITITDAEYIEIKRAGSGIGYNGSAEIIITKAESIAADIQKVDNRVANDENGESRRALMEQTGVYPIPESYAFVSGTEFITQPLLRGCNGTYVISVSSDNAEISTILNILYKNNNGDNVQDTTYVKVNNETVNAITITDADYIVLSKGAITQSGNIYITIRPRDGYYITVDNRQVIIDSNKSVGDDITRYISNPKENNSYCYGIYDCIAGDKFVIYNGQCGSNNRVWCFVDKDGKILSMSDVSIKVNNLEITAPSNAHQLIVTSSKKSILIFKVINKNNELTFINNIGKSIDGLNSLNEYVDTIGWSTGYITTGSVGTDLTSAIANPNATENYKYGIISCQEGDRFAIRGAGLNDRALWSFIDSNNIVLATNNKTHTTGNLFEIITAPAGTAKLVINQNFNGQADFSVFKYRIPDADSVYPTYWDAELADSISKARSNQRTIGNHGDSFIWLTDTHFNSNAGYSPLLINEIAQKTKIRNVIFGGDVITLYHSVLQDAYNEVNSFYELFDKDLKIMTVLGNHDGNSSSGGNEEHFIGTDSIYALYNKQSEGFITNDKDSFQGYYDNPVQKIRYIWFYLGDEYYGTPLMSNHRASAESWVTEKINELDSTWNVVLFTHGLYFRYTESDERPTFSEYNEGVINRILELKRTASANILVWMVGHSHYDYSEVLTQNGNAFDRNDSLVAGENNLRVICTNCDAYGLSNGIHSQTMTVGTNTEQCFDIVSIDTTAKKIYMTRVGAGSDREYSI